MDREAPSQTLQSRRLIDEVTLDRKALSKVFPQRPYPERLGRVVTREQNVDSKLDRVEMCMV